MAPCFDPSNNMPRTRLCYCRQYNGKVDRKPIVTWEEQGGGIGPELSSKGMAAELSPAMGGRVLWVPAHPHPARLSVRCQKENTPPDANEIFLRFCFIFIFPKSSKKVQPHLAKRNIKLRFRKMLCVTLTQTLTQHDSYKSNPLSRSSPGPSCPATTSSLPSPPHPTFNPPT